MGLVLRRARAAKGLLVAAVGAAAVATVLLTGLAAYSGEVVTAGAHSAVAAADPSERSVLVRGSAGGDAAQIAKRDAAVRAQFDGLPVIGAGYAVGREVVGDAGDAKPDSGGVVFASTVFLDQLPEHAELDDGEWATPGASPAQVTLGAAVARTLHAGVGDRLRIADRRSERVTEVVVSGVWHARNPSDPYWLLSPETPDGVAPGSHTYGPIVLHRDDFLRGYAGGASLGWLVRPPLASADLAELTALGDDVERQTATLPARTGLGSSAQVTTRLDQLIDRLLRADLVGRSALLTPMLLIAVIGGYALLLVAALLYEHRRPETALMRARGAGRRQLAGLAAREATLVVLPAALIAPLVVPGLLRGVENAAILRPADLRFDGGTAALTWLVAAVAAVGCLLAMAAPAARRSVTYLEELGSRSRPSRWGAAQRAGTDLALIAFAVLAWTQLRQYASPLTGAAGQLGIDPLLAAAPTLGVLAGAVVALRLLPPATRLAERFVDRRSWTATILGMWQAGRRPHAGPVLLLSLAVSVSTLAWCLAATAERSAYDQADHTAGADLRLVETSGFPPAQRGAQLAELPAVAAMAPAVRDKLRLGPNSELAEVIAVDAATADGVMRMRGDLGGTDTFDRLVDARGASGAIALGAAARRLTGEITVRLDGPGETPVVQTHAVFVDSAGLTYRVALGETVPGAGPPLRFAADLPQTGDRALSLAGFDASALTTTAGIYQWELRDLAVHRGTGGGAEPIDVNGQWQVVDGTDPGDPVTAAGGTLLATYETNESSEGFYWAGGDLMQFSVIRSGAAGPVPAVATPAALTALRIDVGDTTRLNLAGGQLEVRIVAPVVAVPAATTPAALLVDLPSLGTALYQQGRTTAAQEWWMSTQDGRHAEAAAAASRLAGVSVIDRRAISAAAGRDPYGVGARAALFAAALGATLLALVGLAVDARATARRRVGELAVLHTLGAGPRLLARSLIAEQTFLAGTGVAVGLLVGIGVAAAMAPLVILTPAAGRPVPEPLLEIAWAPATATAVAVLAAALGMSALIATTMRRRVAATQLRIGDDQ
jgi:hypothetical protein